MRTCSMWYFMLAVLLAISPLTLISIVAGAETFILRNFPLNEYRIKIITAERLRGEIREYLKSHGYEFVERLTRWGESLWVHESAKDQVDWSVLERFDFPLG